MQLTLLEPPECEPISLQEAKLFLRVETDADDQLIQHLVKVGRNIVEEFTESALIMQTWRVDFLVQPRTYEPYLSRSTSGKQDHFLLPRLPFVSFVGPLKILKANKESILKVYQVNEGTIVLDCPLPADHTLRVDFKCGYGEAAADVPEVFRQAVLKLVAESYENRTGPSAIGKNIADILRPYCNRRLV